MSMRRFAAYFFAITASSIMAFASTLMAPLAPTEAAMNEAQSASLQEHDARLLQARLYRPHGRPAPKIAQVARAK